jgi:upstream activation factor subunit UAF30
MARSNKKPASKNSTRAQARKRQGAGLQQPVEPDEDLGKIVGKRAQPRTQMVKRIWEYIRSHRLQDPKDRRMIVPDETLGRVFDKKQRVSMFEVARMLNRHVRARG